VGWPPTRRVPGISTRFRRCLHAGRGPDLAAPFIRPARGADIRTKDRVRRALEIFENRWPSITPLCRTREIWLSLHDEE